MSAQRNEALAYVDAIQEKAVQTLTTLENRQRELARQGDNGGAAQLVPTVRAILRRSRIADQVESEIRRSSSLTPAITALRGLSEQASQVRNNINGLADLLDQGRKIIDILGRLGRIGDLI